MEEAYLRHILMEAGSLPEPLFHSVSTLKTVDDLVEYNTFLTWCKPNFHHIVLWLQDQSAQNAEEAFNRLAQFKVAKTASEIKARGLLMLQKYPHNCSKDRVIAWKRGIEDLTPKEIQQATKVPDDMVGDPEKAAAKEAKQKDDGTWEEG
ncbi:hypothetical protein C8J57DRAFT_1215952 [Mycena rebaudengoi]|nr:hypothetical protein C8J57DRAFT_1215952 [Mycena rebaudengoi]